MDQMKTKLLELESLRASQQEGVKSLEVKQQELDHALGTLADLKQDIERLNQVALTQVGRRRSCGWWNWYM